jgi:Flp pilus assembly pilin Flp
MPLHVLSRNSRKQASQQGQGMLEYALIVFLIAVVAILGIVFLVPIIINGISGVMPSL